MFWHFESRPLDPSRYTPSTGRIMAGTYLPEYPAMQRRAFLKGAGAGLGLAAASLSGKAFADLPMVKWRMASSFPKSLDTIYGAGEQLANSLNKITGGKFQLRVYAGGEIVPGLQVFDAVQQGTVECGHTASYYYVGKNMAFAFDTAMPFGLTARQQNAWMYFGGGFQANYAIFSTLPSRGDLVVHDELIHASVLDGIRAGKAEHAATAHNDASAIDDVIGRWRKAGGMGRPWIAVESLYSMDGDKAPIDDLTDLSNRHDAMLVIDEAHATGVLGPGGRGLAAHLEGRENVVSLHTCGKALGASGALVLSSRVIRDFMVNRCRPFIYATAPSPLMAAVVRESLRICRDEPRRRDDLAKRVATFNPRFGGSHIAPVVVGTDFRATSLAEALRARGFDVRAIRPPTVPEGSARLRIAITLNVSESDVAALSAALRDELGRLAA